MKQTVLTEPPAYRRFITTCLQANGLLLQLIPPINRDRTLCLQAVRQNGQALAHVPFPLRDYRLCLEAVRSGADDVLPWVPTPHRTATLCRLAVERHGGALRHVTFPLRNKALCMTALRTGRDALRDVPHRFRDLELCLAAQLRFITLSDVPPEIRECPDFHLAILKHRPSALCACRRAGPITTFDKGSSLARCHSPSRRVCSMPSGESWS